MNFFDINKKLDLTEKEKVLLDVLQIRRDRAIDLLLNLPFRYEAKKYIKHANEIENDDQVILEVNVNSLRQISKNYLVINVNFDGALNFIELLFFKFNFEYMKTIYKKKYKYFYTG